MKQMILTIVAIVLTLLLCWANFYAILKTFDFMHAGGAALIPFAFAIFMHALLLFVLIRTAKLPLSNMLIVWSILTVIYLIPAAIAKHNDWKNSQEIYAKINEIRRIRSLMSDEQLLIECADFGNLEGVKNYIEKGADVNATDEDGQTALIAACGMGEIGLPENSYETYINIARFLLENGADVNARMTDYIGTDAIYYAVKYDQPKLAELLIKYGADTGRIYKYYVFPLNENEKHEWRDEPLLSFVHNNNNEMIELLKPQKDISENKQNPNGNK